MKTPLKTLAFAAILFGCATHVGKVNFPEPTATFAPKQTYAAPYEKVWDTTIATLDKNRIATTSADKTAGIIQTDVIEGPASLLALGFVGAQSTHYKYNITIRSLPEGKTRINIIAKLESTIKGSGGASQWTDVSGQNKDRVTKLETWLYEEIEKGL